MNIEVKYGSKTENFDNRQRISIGNSPECDFFAEDFGGIVELVYSSKYNTYVLVNSQENNDLFLNNKNFKKVLVPANFSLSSNNSSTALVVALQDMADVPATESQTVRYRERTEQTVQNQEYRDKKDIFNNPIENNRIAIVKEIGYKIKV